MNMIKAVQFMVGTHRYYGSWYVDIVSLCELLENQTNEHAMYSMWKQN